MKFALVLFLVMIALVAVYAHFTGDTFWHAFWSNSIFAAFGALGASAVRRSR